MDPKKITGPLPLPEQVTLREPCGSATVMHFASGVVVRPWIWCGQPTSNVLLQLVTYKVDSDYLSTNGKSGGLQTFNLINLHCGFLHED
jgi:hypothetical protein